ncbi:hypothetical protein uvFWCGRAMDCOMC440_025 [Freshwater phage uvFW-CGR-AMD-COM-C440]|nr:hypothetical protein uvFWCGRAMDCOMC440_025 [Freshwater phage uvFW-CGR-AMD-COM-C440]
MALPEQTLEALTNGHNHIKFDENGEMTSASGSGLDLYVLVSLIGWIKLELKTGMKITARGSTLRKANEVLGTNYKRKQQALDHLEGLLSILQTGEK